MRSDAWVRRMVYLRVAQLASESASTFICHELAKAIGEPLHRYMTREGE